MKPATQYAKSGDVHIAYQRFGDGPLNLVLVPGFVSHIDNYWDEPGFARALKRIGSFAHVVMFDKRGTGLSDQVDAPDMDRRMDDIRAVMDAAGFDRAALFGISEGGSLASLFAAHHPERCDALVLYGAFARFSQWFADEEALEALFQYIETAWGSGLSLPMFAPSMAEDEAFQDWWGKFERLGANPGAALKIMRMNSQINVVDVLATIQVPTLVVHRTDDVTIDIAGGRELAQLIPNARLAEFSGADHLFTVGDNRNQIMDEIQTFLTGSRPAPVFDRVLATVVFTDIVGSTQKAEALGDGMWREVLERHDVVVRDALARFRGTEVKSMGDGFLATFDGPARAINFARDVSNAMDQINLPVRIGVHTGEVELTEDDVRGIAVHIAARVAGVGQSGDVVVSRTVKDLVVGSGIQFEDFGAHQLRGIADEWNLYRAVA